MTTLCSVCARAQVLGPAMMMKRGVHQPQPHSTPIDVRNGPFSSGCAPDRRQTAASDQAAPVRGSEPIICSLCPLLLGLGAYLGYHTSPRFPRRHLSAPPPHSFLACKLSDSLAFLKLRSVSGSSVGDTPLELLARLPSILFIRGCLPCQAGAHPSFDPRTCSTCRSRFTPKLLMLQLSR